jgi:calpain-15
VDRLKKGPVDWTKIEGTGKIFTDHSFPADQTMLSWKEYPRSIGGLAKYLSWFKDFRRPKDLLNMSAKTQEHPEVSLFGKNNTLVTSDIEQGTLGDNYFLTVALAIAEHNPDIIRNVFSQ